MKKKQCMFCGGSASLLCDGYIGFPPKDENGLTFPDILHPFTCDAPICDRCGTQMMKIFVCGKRPYSGIKTVDHCPICMKVLPPYPEHTRRIIHSIQQAERIRAAHWADFSNPHIQHVKVMTGGGQQSFDF
ncbi:hypothetical protein [Raoultella planticola]|uniref:hypothetical protein n=1 Tax=Raoultella planticola TaxID=575 RepID=UPI000907423D|nr:hypothetical protein [Raoultella planticola]